MAEKSVIDDIKFEEGKSGLTEEQTSAIAEEAMKEIESEKTKEEQWENPADQETEEQKAEKEAELKSKEEADQKVKDEADAKAKQEADEKAKKEAAAKPPENETKEQKEAREKEAAQKVADEGKKADVFKIPDDQRAKAIEELALKESLTLKEAEEQIGKDEAIVNKYKKDPLEMARVVRNLQRESDKTKAELEATRKAAAKPPAPVIRNLEEYVTNQLEPIRDKVVEAYKKENPKLTEGQSDEFVFELVKKDGVNVAIGHLKKNEENIVASAKEKRAEMLLSLSDVDKAFIPDIKAQLERTSPRQLLHADFKLQELIQWAKGGQLDRLVKEAEDRGFKRGQENAKIIGEKLPGGASNKQASGSGAVKTAEARLSDTQKQRAKDMFDSVPGMAEEDMFKAYIDTYPEEFQK